MEETFIAFHGKESFNKTCGIFTKVKNLIVEEIRLRQKKCDVCQALNRICNMCDKMKKVPHDAIMCLVRTRTYIRKQHINRRFAELILKKKNAQKAKKFLPPK